MTSLSLPLSHLSLFSQVNGFEVYDPEEAVLLFLEQDQDISLTVARKVKVCQLSNYSKNAVLYYYGNTCL